MKKRKLLAGVTLGVLAAGCRMTATQETAIHKITTNEEGHFVLRNQNISLTLPDPTLESPYYQGQRFTLPGMVVAAEWQSIPLFTEMGLPHRNPRHHDHVGGTAEEFDINKPYDYDLTEVSGSFMKIGVGLLERQEEGSYNLFRPYPVVQHPEHEVAIIDQHSISFVQTLQEENGERGYRLQFTVSLLEDGFQVERRLRNLGRAAFETEHYSHNFSKIDNLEVGPAYSLSWPQEVEIANTSTSDGSMVPTAAGLSFVQVPENFYSFVSEPESGLAANQPITLKQQEAGIALDISNDRPLHRIAVWGLSGVICPEPFILLRVAPGEEVAWTTTYTVRKDQ